MKYIRRFNESIGKITFYDECLNSYSGQTDMECGVYEDGEVVGYVDYTLYDGELSVKYIFVRPDRRREGFASMLMNYIKKANPDFIYVPSEMTELGAKFKHKQILESNDNSELYKKFINYDLVHDLIDLSMDLIDLGYEIIIEVHFNKSIYQISYSHDLKLMERALGELEYRPSVIFYNFRYWKTDKLNIDLMLDNQVEVQSIIQEMYPDEKIRLMY